MLSASSKHPLFMSSLTDFIRGFEPGTSRFAPPSPEHTSAAAQSQQPGPRTAANEGLDAETLEVVQRFEELYSELAPPAPEPTHDDDIRLDDLHFDLPDDA